jgi:hypothetical protein
MNERGELKNKKPTVGKVATDLAQKETSSRNPIELMRELLTEYDKNIWQCVDNYKKEHHKTDFYIVVVTKKEPLLPNVLRNYFIARNTCPTPDYDQTVYRYIIKDDEIEYLWVIPSKYACQVLIENVAHVVPEEYALLECVLHFADGSLFELAKKLNGEKSLQSSLLA